MHAYKKCLLFSATITISAWLLCIVTTEDTISTLAMADGLLKSAYGKDLLQNLHQFESNAEVESENTLDSSHGRVDIRTQGIVKKQLTARKLLQEIEDHNIQGVESKVGVFLDGEIYQSKQKAAPNALADSERLVPGGPDPLPLYRTRMPKSKESRPLGEEATMNSKRMVPGVSDPFALHKEDEIKRALHPPPPATSTTVERPVPTVSRATETYSSEASPKALQSRTNFVTERLVPTGPDPLHHNTTPQYKIPPKRPAHCSSC